MFISCETPIAYLIEKDIFEKYINNDSNEALRLSLDADIINKNHIRVDYDSIEYTIEVSQEINIKKMDFFDEDIIEIHIVYPYNLNLKLSRIIRKQLNISLNELSYMLEENILSISNTETWKKDKVKDNTLISINRKLLVLSRLNTDK